MELFLRSVSHNLLKTAITKQYSIYIAFVKKENTRVVVRAGFSSVTVLLCDLLHATSAEFTNL